MKEKVYFHKNDLKTILFSQPLSFSVTPFPVFVSLALHLYRVMRLPVTVKSKGGLG